MGVLALLIRETGRPYNMFPAVLLTALVMVLADPFILKFDVGFQLSFLSMLGIIYLAPAFLSFRGSDIKNLRGWKEIAVMTVAAQCAVAPIIIRVFDSFSLLSIIANVLILGIIPATMFLGFLLSVSGILLPLFAPFIAWILHLFLAYEIWIIKTFSVFTIPLGFINSTFLFILYYAFIISVIWAHMQARTPWKRGPLIQ
jgi:competence protein ComEC